MTNQQDLMAEAIRALLASQSPHMCWRNKAERAAWEAMRNALVAHDAAAQLPAGEPEYDRELIAEMLEATLRRGSKLFSVGSTEQQIKLLRAADNRDAEGVHTAKLEEAVTDGCVLVLRELAERVDSALGRFCGDEGWTADDMGTMDDFGAVIAATPKPDNKESR